MFALNRPLRELFLFSLLFSFAQALIMIFEPVFLYQQHFPLWLIAGYYALHYTVYVLLLPLGAMFTARFGVERSLALSTPLLVIYFLALASVPYVPALLGLVLLLLALHKTFFWPAFYTDFARNGDGHHRGRDLSTMNVVIQGVGIIAPTISAVIAALYGFPMLFVVTALLTLAASVPLLIGTQQYRLTKVGYRTPWRVITDPLNWRLVG